MIIRDLVFLFTRREHWSIFELEIYMRGMEVEPSFPFEREELLELLIYGSFC
jgi:hypothetical protein